MSKRYYTRSGGSPPFGGPFTVEEIRREIQRGELSSNCEIQEAVGQTYGSLKRSDGWVPFDRAFTIKGDVALIPATSTETSPQDKRHMAVGLLVIGGFVTIWAFIHMNSLQSQFMRAAGQTDIVTYAGLACGILAVLIGCAMLFGASAEVTPSPNSTVPSNDVATRLRQLQALRDSSLISEDDYQKRKSDILQSI